MEISKVTESHVLKGAYSQVLKFNLKRNYKEWLELKKKEYKNTDPLDIEKQYLRELIEDKEVSSHYFLKDFKDGKYSV